MNHFYLLPISRKSFLFQNPHIVQRIITEPRLSKYLIFGNIGVDPVSCVFGIIPVISQYQITILRHFKCIWSCLNDPFLFQILLLQRGFGTVDINLGVSYLYRLPRKSYNTLDVILLFFYPDI